MKNSTCIRTFKTVFSGLEGRRLYDFGWGADYYQEIRGSSPENGAATIFGTVCMLLLQHGARELTAAKYGHVTGL